MILYSVTCNVSDEAREAWLSWMLQEHIPMVMDTNMFSSYKIFRLLTRQPDEEGTTYSIQYMAPDMANYEFYRDFHAPALQQLTADKFGGHVVAFRSLLEEVL